MADAAAPKPVKKVAKKPAKPAEHPKYIEMVCAAITTLKERGGSSRQAILKYVTANYKVKADGANTHVKLALKRGVTAGALVQAKGTGASGSFKLAKKAAEPKKSKKKPAAKKPAAKKAAKKPAAKKAAKKPAAKKPAAKKAAAKKPAAKKPAAKKAGTPKKAAKKPAKKTKKSPKKAAASKKAKK